MVQEQQIDPASLFAILEDKGSSVTWLASRMGYSREYVSMVKSGRKPVTAAFMDKASRVMSLPKSVLFLSTDVREGTSAELLGATAD